MTKYIVNVNGTEYEITVEIADGKEIKKTENTEKPQAAPAQGGEKVTSPMPGTILSVNVTEGQAVKSGDVLMILEAMKMENEILAPCDGKVSGLSVSKGSTVESGTVLCSLT